MDLIQLIESGEILNRGIDQEHITFVVHPFFHLDDSQIINRAYATRLFEHTDSLAEQRQIVWLLGASICARLPFSEIAPEMTRAVDNLKRRKEPYSNRGIDSDRVYLTPRADPREVYLHSPTSLATVVGRSPIQSAVVSGEVYLPGLVYGSDGCVNVVLQILRDAGKSHRVGVTLSNTGELIPPTRDYARASF